MVEIKIAYSGDLHCELVHGPSGKELDTDAPKDNMGKGGYFSPTDLVASALASCVLTTMGIYAKRHNLNIDGTKAIVLKEMVSDPVRRIGKLTLTVNMPAGLSGEERQILERTGRNCPVYKSLHPDIQTPLTFHYPD